MKPETPCSTVGVPKIPPWYKLLHTGGRKVYPEENVPRAREVPHHAALV